MTPPVELSASGREALVRLRELAAGVGAAAEPMLAGLGEDEAARKALAILAEAELCGWCVPLRDGGADTAGLAADDEVSVRALCAAREELAASSGMLDVMFVMQGLGSYPLARGGSEALRARHLPAIAMGERIAAVALTEPDAGSDLSRISLAAVRHVEGWRLTGQKTFISNAGLADLYCVLARTSGEPGEGGGLTMFLVPGDAPGLSVERFEVTAPHPIGSLGFEGVRVGDEQRLGREGSGMDLALATLGRFRTSVAAAANGFARRALQASVAHLRAREQFGRPLASFQGLRFELAEMDTRLRAAQLLVAEAADKVDAGQRAAAEVARAKLYATETASWICDRAVQHHGGMGVRRGELVERLWREVRALRIYEGTSEVQKLILARELLDER